MNCVWCTITVKQSLDSSDAMSKQRINKTLLRCGRALRFFFTLTTGELETHEHGGNDLLPGVIKAEYNQRAFASGFLEQLCNNKNKQNGLPHASSLCCSWIHLSPFCTATGGDAKGFCICTKTILIKWVMRIFVQTQHAAQRTACLFFLWGFFVGGCCWFFNQAFCSLNLGLLLVYPSQSVPCWVFSAWLQ